MNQALTVEPALRLALEHHRECGHFSQAGLLYRKILQSVPGHLDALHWSGMLAHLAGKGETARDLVSRALERKPADHIMHFNVGVIDARLGHHEDAILCYRKAITLKSDFADAYNDLGIALSRKSRRPRRRLGHAFRRPAGIHCPDGTRVRGNRSGPCSQLAKAEPGSPGTA